MEIVICILVGVIFVVMGGGLYWQKKDRDSLRKKSKNLEFELAEEKREKKRVTDDFKEEILDLNKEIGHFKLREHQLKVKVISLTSALETVSEQQWIQESHLKQCELSVLILREENGVLKNEINSKCQTPMGKSKLQKIKTPASCSPRGGNRIYSENELSMMWEFLMQNKATGVVRGLLFWNLLEEQAYLTKNKGRLQDIAKVLFNPPQNGITREPGALRKKWSGILDTLLKLDTNQAVPENFDLWTTLFNPTPEDLKLFRQENEISAKRGNDFYKTRAPQIMNQICHNYKSSTQVNLED